MRVLLFGMLALAACGGGSEQASCVQPLFQNWHLVSFTPLQQGAVGVSVVSLVGGRYGAGQRYGFSNGCSFAIDIERGTTTGNSEQGTATFTDPQPNQPPCSLNTGTTAYTLTCSQMSLADAAGIGTYNPG